MGENRFSPQAFPKLYRLTKTDEFSSVFGFRKAIRSTHFLLHYRIREASEAPGARLGIVVAKRLLKRSVDRNLVRRLIREAFRSVRNDLPSRDLIVRLATRPQPIDRRALAHEVQTLLGKLVSHRR